jgi:Protein of unknown function (DUF2691)
MSTMPEGAALLALHDHGPTLALSFDLRDILAALGEHALGWQWCVLSDFEAYGSGEGLVALTEAIWRAQPGGIWLSAPAFARLAQAIDQTIDGEFQAFPSALAVSTVSLDELHAPFLQCRADLVIRAVDSTCFEVYAKHREDVERIQAHFSDVQVTALNQDAGH